MDYKKFNDKFDIEGLKKDMAELSNSDKNNNTNDEVPVGDYEVSIEKLELTESKASGNPMVTCWMKILVGDYTGRLLFYNQVINNAYGIHNVKEFLKSLASLSNVQFEDFDQFGQLINEVHAYIVGKHEYLVNVSEYASKGRTYRNYKIKKVYDI